MIVSEPSFDLCSFATPQFIKLALTFIHPSLSGADGGADAEEGRVPAGEGEGDGVEDVVGVDDEEVEGQVDGVRGRVLREQPVPHRAALVQLEVLEDVGAEHLRQAADHLKEETREQF